MSSGSQAATSNLLLAALSGSDFAMISPHLEPIVLTRALIIVEPNEPAAYVVFPDSGIISQVALTPENRRLEVGIYGREGVGPSSSIAGVDRTPHQHFVQVEGSGQRIEVKTFDRLMNESPTLRALLMRYMHVFLIQTSYTALSNGSGVIGERLARWLMMCQDRLDADDIALTHEFLGVMLGVRRSGVTDAIHRLEGVRIIRAVRGRIQILDRERLEDAAGDSYGVPESEYERLIGPMRRSDRRPAEDRLGHA